MHWRAIQLARSRRLPRVTWSRYKSTTRPVAKTQTNPLKKSEEVASLDKLTSQVIKAAGNAQHWPGWREDPREAEAKLWRNTNRLSNTYSETKEKFMAAAAPRDSSEEPLSSADADDEDIDIPVGSFVELRRNALTVISVVIGTRMRDLKRVFITITPAGEIIENIAEDVTWATPDFIPESIAQDCGHGLSPETPAEHAARVHVSRKLRQFERQFEQTQNRLASQFNKMYNRTRNPDGTQYAELKTVDAAAMLVGPGAQPSLLDVFCTHRLLMQDAMRFVCHPGKHRVFQSFLVRPLNDVGWHQDVIEWCRDPNKVAISSFAEKAKTILAYKKPSTLTDEPLRLVQPVELPIFDSKDKRIIAFLRQGGMSVRHIQKDWYLAFGSQILRACGYYEHGTPIEASDFSKFLRDIGILLPWDDDSWMRPHMFALSREPQGTSSVERHRMKLAAQRAPPEAPLSLRPHRDELYPRDVMEPLRHDFGQLPVYIIDEASASELDDGISIERIPGDPAHNWIHVHIADPSTLLHPEHEISQAARQISTTVYYLHRTWAMLPDELAMKRFSLGAPLREDWPKDQPMETMTFSAKVAEDGSIVEHCVRAGYIRKPIIMTYNSVSAALGDTHLNMRYPFQPDYKPPTAPPVPESSIPDLQLLDKVTSALRRKRYSSTFLYNVEKVAISLRNKDSLPVRPHILTAPSFARGAPDVLYGVLFNSEMSRSQLLVSEAAIQAARLASITATELDIPILRRSVPPVMYQRPEDREELMAMRDPDTGVVPVHEAIARSLGFQPGHYTLQPSAHEILGITEGDGYARATSPLRRYLDLVTHWQLKTGLLRAAGKPHPPAFGTNLLRNLAAEQGTKEQANRRAMQENEKFWAVSFIQRQLERGKESMIFDGLTLMVPSMDLRTRTYYAKVHIPALGMFATVTGLPTKECAGIAEPMRVEITRVKQSPPVLFARRV